MSTILIVDDDERMLRACSRLLAGNFEVTAVGCPLEALNLLRSGKTFDTILSDFHMPGMTGAELFSHLQGERPEMAERMVFMSGGGPGLFDFLRRVPNRSILKPFKVEELLTMVTAS